MGEEIDKLHEKMDEAKNKLGHIAGNDEKDAEAKYEELYKKEQQARNELGEEKTQLSTLENNVANLIEV